MAKRAIIALGSNLGEPVQNLKEAVERLQPLSVAEIRSSSIWKSMPVGFEEEVPEFCNAVVVFETDLEAQALLDALKAIEAGMGRSPRKSGSYESRVIDLDIIDLGGLVLDETGLTLPHPGAHERRFVLLPLKEVVPDYRFPGVDSSINALIASAPSYPVQRFIPLNPLV
ncbi:MAG: 2-amino-4-hydroxy-6-hydroxymethyldihydropteridine diphosphokinase [Gammaproteobacteria bacterium]|jgi:2-amino-4-hydroxy-6-hydroxymethyldihydropteridine diphosphokinase|nr:2-amino-4-hydroxy-6-hydroxymethyldihydropteridine diphosphokinase [Gammaproteobacteria bacterium]MBT4491944.1 2-amino-4-hydroxy-6-hydroxymethyldihydropteridine diphosphokinase [Gammaproteobacteria bacterium]MBT7369120.1 2-amino-4-hydroxy-6-hydroxymethyldihydropteridine diphosphokinase [Gammaproteobacteria bacterium]